MSEMKIKRGSLVMFTYQITDLQDQLLERTDIPMSYVHGSKQGLLEKVERSLEGRHEGEVVRVQLTPEEGFGLHDETLTFIDSIENVPEQFHHLGAEVEMRNDEGEARLFHVSKIESGKLTVDGNHPLAGKGLIFTVSIHEVRDATREEVAAGWDGNSSIPVMH
jgi:FKBP-type peptidyl-prolyl cis-trans isomerase SlyD